jgi:hypothetical protein
MLLTLALVVLAMIALAALELWPFRMMGEREDRRRAHAGVPGDPSSHARSSHARRGDVARPERRLRAAG